MVDTAVVFVHMPKTAGTTLHQILVKGYSSCSHIESSGLKTLDEILSMPDCERRKLDVIRGHMNYGVHEVIRKPCVYITCLRNPVSRILSHFAHIQRDSKHPLFEEFTRTRFTFRDFFGKTTDNDNGQMRALAGEADSLALFNGKGIAHGECDQSVFDQALENLGNFTWIGFQESFDDCMVRLARKMGWEKVPDYAALNVGSYSLEDYEISQVDLDYLAELNRYDIELYERAKHLAAEL